MHQSVVADNLTGKVDHQMTDGVLRHQHAFKLPPHRMVGVSKHLKLRARSCRQGAKGQHTGGCDLRMKRKCDLPHLRVAGIEHGKYGLIPKAEKHFATGLSHSHHIGPVAKGFHLAAI